MSDATIEPPYFPIIYVRGYAGGQSEVEDTVADPYMGFNLGSTKVRQRWNRDVERHYFESPLVRLMKDFEYRDVYDGGKELPHNLKAVARSIFIYRYYDQVSTQLGIGERGEIVDYADGLGELIIRVRDWICGDDADARKDFKVYLVAHSMGGLVCRCFLQNPKVFSDEARAMVDKVFTYATPHNGIDLRVVGNLPGFFTRNNADNFNRKEMKKYLGFPRNHPSEDVASLRGEFDPERFFCLVGTNHRDYGVAGGLSSKVVGPSSDGLVRIANATVHGPKPDGAGYVRAPRAYVHRSHSGHYGIVNSEEGYQNLVRFLFGDIRVDGHLELDEISLPEKVQRAFEDNRLVRASYNFEVIVRTRGALWDLHRRTVAEESAIFRSFDELFRGDDGPRNPRLASIFLAGSQQVNIKRQSLGFCIDLGVTVPQYEVDERLWFDDHYDGGYLYRDKINLEAIPPEPTDDVPRWRILYGFDSKTPNLTGAEAEANETEDGIVFRVPIEQNTRPGLRGTLVLHARPWNG